MDRLGRFRARGQLREIGDLIEMATSGDDVPRA